MVSSAVNTWAVFRFALGYPDERHLARFGDLCETAPATLEELRSLYIDLFVAACRNLGVRCSKAPGC
jgi:hypothetical protein